MHNFTPENLLQYLYNETDADTTAQIEEALANDWTLKEKLKVLQSSLRYLNQIQYSPRTEAVLNILDYAEKIKVKETNKV